MKKILLAVITITLVFGLATVLMARESGQPGVLGTPHDVQVITGEAGLEPCAMCHSPHSGSGDYPAWNRDQAAQTYTMYASPTFDMASVQSAQPNSPSSLCLVCHNGVFSSLVNYPGPGSHQNENYDYEMNPTFWAMLGTNLTDDHPISFEYDPALDNDQDDNGFPNEVPCPTAPWRLWIPGGEGALTYPLYGTGAQANMFECATCHSVHDTVNYPGKTMVGGKSVGTQVFFLRTDNTSSALCADCHVNRL
jgi:hypothetical protein